MRIGQTVHFYSLNDGYRRSSIIQKTHIYNQNSVDPLFETTEGNRFYMQAEGKRHYNFGNRAFWVEQ